MGPLEKISAAASRLVQEAESLHGGHLSIRLKEMAATLRGAVATIRSALEGNDRRPQHPKFGQIVGDERLSAVINAQIAAATAAEAAE